MDVGVVYGLTRYILETEIKFLDLELLDEILNTLNYIFEEFCSDDKAFTFKKDCSINEQLRDKANYLLVNLPREEDFEFAILPTLERFFNILKF